MIQGVVDTKTVITHGWTIINNFGITIYMMCLWVLITRKKTTFLNIVVGR